MTKEDKKNKEFDTVKFFREVKEKISNETKGMSFAEFKALLNNRKLKLIKNRMPNAKQPICVIAGLRFRFEVLALNKLQSSIER